MGKGHKKSVKDSPISDGREKLIEKRTSISAGEFPKIVRARWPLGRVTLFRGYLVLDACIEQYNLLYSEIDSMEFKGVQVVIYHHNPKVPRDITIDGIFIPGILKKAIKQYGLPVKVE